ncbi:MAG: hypothetical protein HQ596_04925 [Candidatus Saganbacteria bacterium]|nr:hypothetical protein [Candidatus Saganbacteria bacterium]
MDLEAKLKEQIDKLAVIQYLVWQAEHPEGINWDAIEISACYHFLEIPYQQKVSRFTLGILRAMLSHFQEKHKLPKETAKLKVLEKSFRLEVDDKRIPVSDCTFINQLLAKEGSKVRLCSGFYGNHKFYILAEAKEEEAGKYKIYRLKKEITRTPGCHLLMAAMVGNYNIFLREASARFLFYQKWRNALGDKDTQKTVDKIKKFTLDQFGIKTDKDFKGKSKELISAFIDNLFYHELNHNSIASYVKNEELQAIGEASRVLGENILNHLLEVFTDWLPGSGTQSPLQKIFEEKNLGKLGLYVADNWFYDSSFPEQNIFSSLDLAPLFRHSKAGKFDWPALIHEMKDCHNGSLLHLYQQKYEEIAKKLKKIVEESEFVLRERPINFKTISLYSEIKIKDKNKGASQSEYLITHWSNIFAYLKKFSKKGYRRAMDYLRDAEKELVREIGLKIGTGGKTIEQTLRNKTQEVFSDATP